MNYKDCCRTCLQKDKEMRHLHTAITIAGDHVSDEMPLPETICINCVHQLTITYSFKVLIESSEKTLTECTLLDPSINENYDCSLESDDQKPEIVYQRPAKRKLERKKSVQSSQNSNYECESKDLYCVECKSIFGSAKILLEHCLNHHPVKNSIGRDCDYCNEKFEDFRSLVLHRKLHMKPFLCENCWEGFYNSSDLNGHHCQPSSNCNDKAKPDRVLRQCDQCGKSYPPGYIRIHMLTHSNDRPYSCKYCPKKFKVPGGLHSHIQWNHKRTRNHKCEVCNATFISSSSRSSHIRKNHLKEKKYGCESCGKRFFSKSELQRHSLTHTGVKNFHCHLCDKSYQTRYGLNVHLKSHSQISVL